VGLVETRQTEIDDAEWRNPANWHGPVYFSRRDSRGFVPNRKPGIGPAINFAHPAGYGFVIGALAFAAVVIWLRDCR
jgi:uncharacterized membrane protein